MLLQAQERMSFILSRKGKKNNKNKKNLDQVGFHHIMDLYQFLFYRFSSLLASLSSSRPRVHEFPACCVLISSSRY